MTSMRRRLATLVAVSAVAGVAMMFAPTTSAQAAVPHGLCAGTGTAHLSAPLVYPVSLPGPAHSSAKSAGFTFHFNAPTGVCVSVTPTAVLVDVSAEGSVHGWCGLSAGGGTSSLGDDFMFVGVGGTLVVTGEVAGVVNAAPNALLGDTCTNHVPGADDFLINGVVVRNSCAAVNTSVGTGVPVLHSTIPVSVHVCV